MTPVDTTTGRRRARPAPDVMISGFIWRPSRLGLKLSNVNFWKVLRCGIFYSDMLHFNPVTPRLAAAVTAGNVCAVLVSVITHKYYVDVVMEQP